MLQAGARAERVYSGQSGAAKIRAPLKRDQGDMFKTRRSHSDLPQATRIYSSADVARIASVSLRQLQWWDERKVVSPRHEGRKRTYLPQDVVEITVIAELRRKGFSLQKIRRVLRFLQREMGKHLDALLSSASNLHLLTDGKSIFLEEKQDRIIDLLKNSRQPMFLVCVSDQVRRLELTPRKPARSEIVSGRHARWAI
jgi:DNA-binding transcriptional MerR regulator